MLQPTTKFNFACRFIQKRPDTLPYFLSFLLRRSIRGRSYSRNDGFSAPPSVVTFAVTDYCNLDCKMCPFQSSNVEKNHLDMAIIKKVIDQIYNSKPYISLCGRGEPFMHPEFFNIISYVKSKGLWCAVDTNGTLLERNVDQLLNSHIDLVSVSIDSIGDVQDEIRGVPGTFQKIVAGIKALRAKAEKSKPIIRVNCVITGYSADHLEKVYELAKDLGVDMLNFSHSMYIRTESMLKAQEKLSQNLPKPREKISWDTVDIDGENINAEKIAQTINRLSKKDEGVIVSVTPNLANADEIKKYYSFKGFVEINDAKCAWKHSNIYPNGDVEMCDGLYPMGNLNDSDFLKIWNNDNFREFRKKLKETKRFPICSACCRYYHYH
ncbi:MAG: radical SAM protein [Dehalococcoidales bacterium]|nr:radical SAM protein [Dehalococcoidales bacterium]